LRQFTESDAPQLLYGASGTERIVSVEPSGANEIALYQRQADGSTHRLEEYFAPWIVTRADSRLATRSSVVSRRLEGDLPLSTFLSFRNRAEFRNATDSLSNDDYSVLAIKSPVSQYLIASGNTMFKGMQFLDIRRLQLDIETLGLDPAEPDAEIIMIALRQGEFEQVLVQESTEAELLERFVEVMQKLDPDVIEGHNVYLFDLPYLIERSRQTGVTLSLGRDGTPPSLAQSRSNFRVGPVSLPYTSVHIRGRHIVDTYQQIQRWDVQGRLSSYGLKSIMQELGLERDDRVHVEGERIAELWRAGERSRDRLVRYALDDVRDVDRLSRITLPTEFYQTQIVPMSLQTATAAGMGTKIDHLMIRAYLAVNHSLPTPAPSRPFAGAYLELIKTGVFGPIVKADVESLYPSIMLEKAITSRNDVLKAFPLLLRDLTSRRIDAKRSASLAVGDEFALWDGLQGSFKVLINSFFGYLGFGRGRFNDFDAAEEITLEGQRLIQLVVSRLKVDGADPIEVDTDGVFFTPPPSVRTRDEEEAFVQHLSEELPGRIRLAHDGRYERMMSLKLKNYALLAYDGAMTMKGSALRSRRMEPCLREFLKAAAFDFMRDQRDAARERYFELAELIVERRLPPAAFSQWSMLRQSTIGSRPRLKQLLESNTGRWRYGERVSLYERADGTLGFTEDYDRDENTSVLLRHLKDTASRFELLFEHASDFEAFFPTITPTTSLEQARMQQSSRQLDLFS
jgi:DNA polymerase elongation subunit (family B)